MTVSSNPFVLLTVLDGWGMAPTSAGNAVAIAKTPNFNRFWAAYPHTQLRASGEAVGLPRGEVGNTETGHLNLGAGRIVYQDLARINMSIADGSFFENEVLVGACLNAIKNNSKLHIMGLLGAGGVHSSIDHLFALVHLAGLSGVKNLFIHVFTDGRDSPPNASMAYVARLREVLEKEKIGEIASIMGRYWAMDRDARWDRTEKAYKALTHGIGRKVKSVEEAIKASYENSISDEFIEPTVIVDASGNPRSTIDSGDSVIFFNFRIDRPRQLTRAFVMDDLAKANQLVEPSENPSKTTATPVFNRGTKIANLFFVTMTEYSRDMASYGTKIAFPPENVKMPLGRVISLHNLRQLRAAESEKERFVTYYFNGQTERADVGEDRIIVPSPKVATYDLVPEMSAYELTRQIYTRLIHDHIYSFALVNFANADMVGHTGNLFATVKAVETVDACLGELSRFVLAHGGVMIITSDHGNAEEMINSDGSANTEHSSNPVPFVAISKDFISKGQMLPFGILADIAPTVLAILGIAPATAMTGRNLLAPVMKVRRR